MEKEIWKNIDNYEGYQVSNLGRIRTHNKITYTKLHGARVWKDRILKPKISEKDKCSRVELWKNGEHKTFLVHRLVANAFLEKKIDTNLTVNHIDGNRLNNKVSNLEWMTREENIRDGFKNDLYPQIHCKLIKDDKEYNFNSLSKANIFLGRNHNYINNRLKNNAPIIDKKGNEYVLKID